MNTVRIDAPAQPDLFATMRAELTRYWSEVAGQADRQVLRFPPSHADRLGHTLFASLRVGGLSTLLVTGHSVWDPASHYYESCREAARRDLNISRLFLLPHRHCKHDPHLRRHLELDRAAGIHTSTLYVGELISSFELPLTESLEIGLWDDLVTCVALYGSSGAMATPIEWRVSQRREDVERHREVFAALRSRAEPMNVEAPTVALELEEPMVTTAPVVQTLAPVLCQGDHVSPEDCSWYHGIWQYLRIFNLVSTPTWHSEFYTGELEALARSGEFSRILISGTADYSMLAYVLWAYRNASTAANVTVLDLCETPLFLCKWYAKLVGSRVTAVSEDIFKYKPETPFDLITTDAFLTRFSPEERPELISNWKRLLRAGGQVVTTVRVEEGLAAEVVRTTPQQVTAFKSKALQEARRWQGFLGLSPEETASQAATYAERMISYSFRSVDELVHLLKDGGFDIDRLIKKEVPGEMASTLYCEVVARRT
jgi:SAM-dependent methyltransferase